MRVYQERIATGRARAEGRWPSHNGEYVTLFWIEGGNYIVEDNAGICASVYGDSYVAACCNGIGPPMDDEEQQTLTLEAVEVQAEIDRLREGDGALARHCGRAAEAAMIEAGWLEREQIVDLSITQ
jgi:hypothetical protein